MARDAASAEPTTASASVPAAGEETAAPDVPAWKKDLQKRKSVAAGGSRAADAAGGSRASEASTPAKESAAQGGVPKWKEELLSKKGKSGAPTSGEKPAPSGAAGEEPPWKKELRQRKSFVGASPAAAGSSTPSSPAGRDDGDSAGELAAILQRRKEKAQS